MTRADCLDTAKNYVSADRQTDYGTPEQNFSRISSLWSAYKGVEFSAHDVAAMLALVKVARIATSPAKADNWVDLAGYAACGAEVSDAT